MIVVIMHAIIMLRTCHREYRGITVGCCTGLDSGEFGSRDFLYRILKCASQVHTSRFSSPVAVLRYLERKYDCIL